MPLFRIRFRLLPVLDVAALFAASAFAFSRAGFAQETAPLPNLFVVGDSTARNNANGAQGWGNPFKDFFDASKISVLNRAMAGRSSRTFLSEGRWDNVLEEMKAGDVVLLQLRGPIDSGRARASLPGLGDETRDITKADGTKETVHTFGWNMRKMVADARAKGATPILRNSWTNGKINRNANSYGGWAEQVAKPEHVAFLPLNMLIARRADELGTSKVEPLFHGDSTHTSLEGAKLNAQAATLPTANDAPLFRLDFGSAAARAGFTPVASDALYNKERGFGFEVGAQVSATQNGISGDKPFLFSVALPEGNYNVTLTLGDQDAESTTTVKAEQRRLMLEQIQTQAGKFATRSFTVNIRTPQISTGGQVRLKDRERANEMANWDDKLTLEFNGVHPSLRSLEIARADNATTVYLLGDSTVCDQPNEPYSSWGQMLPRFFDKYVAVANNAQSGETLRSSLGAKRLEKVLSTLKSGDYAFIQFGHNDMKERGEGIGAFTSYKTDLKHYADEVRKKGGIPVLVTPVNRRTFDADGHITNSLGDYPEAVRQLAREENLALIDLHAMSKTFYEALARDKSKLAFAPGDGTHHNNYGSYELARCVVEGIRQNKLGLVSFLSDDTVPFDPAHPDALETFDVPASPSPLAEKPDGN